LILNAKLSFAVFGGGQRFWREKGRREAGAMGKKRAAAFMRWCFDMFHSLSIFTNIILLI
jgi:hypothetical protein